MKSFKFICVCALLPRAFGEFAAGYLTDDDFSLPSPIDTRSTVHGARALSAVRLLAPASGSRRMIERVCPPGLVPMSGAMCGHIDKDHAVVQQVDVKQIVRETLCPEGTVLVHGQCEGLESVPPQVVCPPSTIMRNGECLSFDHPQCECPSGFHRRQDHCIARHVFPAQYTCPPEYTLDEPKHACVKMVPQPPMCAPGWKLVRKDESSLECVMNTPSSLRCPPGMELSYATHQCTAIDKMPAQIVCPEGADLHPESNKCTVTVQPPPYCPRGFTFNAETNECVQLIAKVPAACPAAFKAISGICELVEKSEAERFCPEESHLDGTCCLREFPVPPRCPTGFHLTSETGCEKVVEKIPECPEGTEMVDVHTSHPRCKAKVNHDLKMCCPPGFEMIGSSCHRIEELAPILSCEGQCFRVSVSPLAYACPPGSLFIDAPTGPMCAPEGAELPQSCTAGLPPRCLDSTKRAASLLKTSSNTNNNNNSTIGVALRTLQMNDCFPPPTACPELSLVPAQPFCPDGGEIDGDKCLTKTPIIPEMKCRVGKLDEASGKCVRERVVPAKSECPPGTKREGFECITFDMRIPDFICPPQSRTNEGGVCTVDAPAIPQPDRVTRSPSMFRCPPGQELDGAICVSISRLPQALECPVGSAFADILRYTQAATEKCVKVAPLIAPPSFERPVKPSFVCPPTHRLTEGNVCVEVRKCPAENICPDDTALAQLDNGAAACVHSRDAIVPPPRTVICPARAVCPPHLELKGDQCIETERADLHFYCPPGFVLESREKCVRRQPTEEVCPTGTRRREEGCCRKVTFAPSVRVVEGCTHSVVPADCPDCPRSVETTCTA